MSNIRTQLDLDKLIERRLEEHNQELYQVERRLEEYIGLRTERKIRIEEGYLIFLKKLRLRAIELMSRVENARPPILPDAVADWDFENANWTLDTSIYVSSPSSLKIWDNLCLCNRSEVLNVVEGRIVSYWKASADWGGTGGRPIFHFRNNASVGTANYNNCYYVLFNIYDKKIVVGRAVGGSFTILASVSLDPTLLSKVPANVFNKWRVTWWNDTGGAGIVIRTEAYYDDAWNKAIDDVVDPANYWSSPDTRRVGLWNELSNYNWFDDTEIWSA